VSFDQRIYYKKIKAFEVGDALVYWHQNTMHEVPYSKGLGWGWLIEGKFHPVRPGNDIRNILELKGEA
jgi:hypothetical protein